jgi:hypothetical protein
VQFHIFSSFLPFENPLGFGASDFIELFLAATLGFLVLVRPATERTLRSLGRRNVWCMVLLAALPVALRLLLLSHHPVPSPENPEESSQLLAADTLRHFRLANPPHPFHGFFETLSVLQEPRYSSIYPIGSGMVLALGRLIFGHPWAGEVLSVAAFCSLSYWMLRAWTKPGWALAGGLLAVFQFGPLSQWMNGYSGAAVSAAAACLVFGSLPRLMGSGLRRDAAWLGLGLGIQILTRPVDSVFLLLIAIMFLIPAIREPRELSRFMRTASVLLLAALPAVVLTTFHNKAVTGSWTTSPAALSRYEYGVPAAFTFQPDPIPHRELTPEQQMLYKVQTSLRGAKSERVGSYLARLEYRVRWYRSFLLAPLYLGFLAFLLSVREFRDLWILLTLAILALGANFEADIDIQNVAAIAPVLILMSVRGLQHMSRFRFHGRAIGGQAARLIAFLCAAHFLFWYGLHLFETSDVAAAMIPYETWDSLHRPGSDRRIQIVKQLAMLPGRQLVFVHDSPAHSFLDEWVYNDADIDSARTVWARDRGAAENRELQTYYSSRSVWLLNPDERPPRLSPYAPEPAPSPLDTSRPKTSVPPRPATRVSPFDPIP